MDAELMGEDEFIHTVMHAAELQAGNRAALVLTAFVMSYDPRTNRVKCIVPGYAEMTTGQMLQTGWISLGSIAASNGWGIQAAPFGGATQDNPSAGEQITLQILNTGNGSYVASVMTWNAKSAVPLPTIAAGEMYMRDAKGNSVYFKSDGSLNISGVDTVNVSGASTVNIVGSAGVNVSSSSVVNVTAPSINLGASGQSLMALVTSAFSSLFNGHTHPTPGGTSGAPNQQMGAGELTSTVKGG